MNPKSLSRSLTRGIGRHVPIVALVTMLLVLSTGWQGQAHASAAPSGRVATPWSGYEMTGTRETPLAATTTMTFTVYLPLVMRPSPPSTSIELIDAALARGEIDAETAFIYKAFAVYEDPRLPPRFKGTVTEAEAEKVVRQFGEQLESLTATGQRTLLPFIQPPAYSGSWYEMQRRPGLALEQAAAGEGETVIEPPVGPGWQSAGPAEGKVKVWWNQNDTPGLGRAASAIAEAMNDTIWPKETSLMGREPLSDRGPHVFEDKGGQTHVLGDGGDGRFDIYLVTSRAGSDQLLGLGGAATVSYPPDCKKRPAFMLVSGSFLLDVLKLEAALIHEFSHAIQFAYNYAKECKEYHWMEEATAVWMVDYVSPRNQREHSEFELSEFPAVSLDEAAYDAWPFFFWLARQYSPNVIKFSWSQTEYDDSLASINAALSGDGGLQKYWPEFVLRAWNRAPFDQFQQWDGYSRGAAALDEPLNLSGQQSAQVDLNRPVPHLAAAYFDIKIDDPQVRSLSFYNPFYPQAFRDPAAKIRALVKVRDRDWYQEDWTGLSSRRFCRDLREERVDELVIIISNSAWEDRSHILQPPSPPHVAATNIGCWRWSGTATAVVSRAPTGAIDSFSAQVTWELDPSTNSATPGGMNTYHVLSGTLSGTRSGSDSNGCTYSGSVSGVPLQRSDGWITLVYIYAYQPYDLGRFYANAAASQSGHTFTRTCPGGSTSTWPWDGFPYMNTRDQRFYVSADGRTLTGTATYGGERYTWDLRAVDPQP